MKSYKHLFCCLSLVALRTLPAYADDTCEQRFGELNERFTATYVKFEAECYPTSDSPVVTSCSSFTLTPECQSQYDALATEVSSAWDQFFSACPDYLRPTIADNFPERVAGNERFFAKNPVTKAPSKQELLTRVSNLRKRVSALKKSLRQAQRARRVSERRCQGR